MNDRYQREEALFDAALQLPQSDRGEFLDQSCAGDQKLRQRVESLLRSHGQTSGIIERMVEKPTSMLEMPVSEKPGERIGRYKLLEQIGEGGCGVVYMAEQETPVKRRVALKIIKLGMDTKQVIARFEAERQVLALMDHANIAKVFDAGSTETGRPYFVMELVRGTRLTEYCDANNSTTGQRLGLFAQVCKAIEHAHQKGIIHRDIKPSNILVTLQDGEPTPKVIDFGIAKATGGVKLTDQTLFTSYAQFLGTPAYMSPEQAQLTSQDIDTRSDIYSLGVLLYELMTGKTPFETKELLQAGLDEMLRTIREKEPNRPSTRLSMMLKEAQTTTAKHRQTEAPKLVQILTGDLDWIVMKCLEKDRARRYETANGLLLDVRRFLENEAVLARPPSRAYQLRKLIRRHRLAFTVTVAVTGALALGLGISTTLFFQQKAARARADAEASQKQEVAAFLQEMLQGVGPGAALGRDTKLLREILDKTADRVGRGLTNQPTVEAELRSTVGGVYFALAQYAEAEAMQRRALELRRQQLGMEHVVVADALVALGLTLQSEKKLAEAERMQREALALRRKLLGGRLVEVASSLSQLGLLLSETGKWAEAETMEQEALTMRRQHFGAEHAEVARSWNNLAAVLVKAGKFSEAEQAERTCMAIWRKLLPEAHPDLAQAAKDLAAILLALGKLHEAETAEREALAVYRKLLDPTHPTIVLCLNTLGQILHTLGKLEESETTQREALARQRKAITPDALGIAGSLTELGQILGEQGRMQRAESMHREALAIRRQNAGPEHSVVANSLESLTRLLLNQGRAGDAEPLARECLTIREKQLPDSWETFKARSLLGSALGILGRREEAERMLVSGYEGMKQREGQIPYYNLLQMEAALGRLARFYEKDGPAERASTWQRTLKEAIVRRNERIRDKLRRAAESGEPSDLNELAWMEATALCGDVRNGTNAVRLAEQAVKKAADPQPRLLITLAAAYAETGNYSKAEQLQGEAIGLTTNETMKASWRRVGRFYHAGAPLRDYVSAADGFRSEQMLAELEAVRRDELASARRTFPEIPGLWAGPVFRLALILLSERQAAEAERVFGEVLPVTLLEHTAGALLITARASFRAQQGAWARAAADAERLPPTTDWVEYNLPVLRLASGNLEGFRADCEKGLKRLIAVPTSSEAKRLTFLLLAVAPPESAWNTISTWADFTLQAAGNPDQLAQAQFTKGLLEYRQGHFAGAIDWLEKANQTAEANFRDEVEIQIHAVLAMARHQLNQPELARTELDRSLSLADAVLPKLESGYLGPGWAEWVFAHTFMEQAKALIGR